MSSRVVYGIIYGIIILNAAKVRIIYHNNTALHKILYQPLFGVLAKNA